MKLYHTSSDLITQINPYGRFDDCLFFATRPYVPGCGGSDGSYTYSIEIDESDIIDVCMLDDNDIVSDIVQKFLDYSIAITADDAAELLYESCKSPYRLFSDEELHNIDHDDLSVLSDFVQAQQGLCAKKMGFRACRASDEQGAVYIIPMLDCEHNLTLED